MDSEVPLPPPRRLRHRSPARAGASPSPFVASFQKARRLPRLDDRSSQPSSDPALFSSDDIPASGLENYNASVTGGNGRKRRYRGTWWGEQVVDPKRKRADFKEKRHVDSGVWMGSDESTADSLLPSEDGSSWGDDFLKTVLEPRTNGNLPRGLAEPRASSLSSVSTTPIMKGPLESEEHQFARAVINDCLEKGEDSVDLGNLHLRDIPRGLLRPLQHLTKLPSVKEAPLSENAYSSLQPFLRIYLPGNALMSLNNELFELDNLKVLSVRNNKLSELPHTIQKLTALEVLNISVNRLTHLPWELLQLFQHGELKHLTAFPNPFPSIGEQPIAQWHCQLSESHDSEFPLENRLRFDNYEGSPPESSWSVLHVATGPVTLRDMEGSPADESSAIGVAQRVSPSSNPASYAPSLRELALRAVCKLPGLDQITDEEVESFPSLVIPLICQAKKTRATGGQQCSVCQKEYIVPRVSWLEWWDCTPHEGGMKRPRAPGEKLRPLPFQRYGCSWACVPGSTIVK